MSVLFVAITIFAFSLVVIQILQHIASKSTRITLLLKRYQFRIILGITIIIVLMPFVLLSILGETATFAKIIKNFLISLFASISFGITIEYLRHLRNTSKIEERNKESSDIQSMDIYEEDQKTIVELKTLERYGFDSVAGVSFNSLNRLGNQFGELVMLEREIDALELPSIGKE